MNPKQLSFIVATSATMGAIAGAYGDAVIFSDTALAGQNELRAHVFTLNSVPAAFNTRIEAYLATTECASVEAKYGDGTCDPSTIPYEIKLIRRDDGKSRVVGKVSVPVFVTKRPPPVPPVEGNPELP